MVWSYLALGIVSLFLFRFGIWSLRIAYRFGKPLALLAAGFYLGATFGSPEQVSPVTSHQAFSTPASNSHPESSFHRLAAQTLVSTLSMAESVYDAMEEQASGFELSKIFSEVSDSLTSLASADNRRREDLARRF